MGFKPMVVMWGKVGVDISRMENKAIGPNF